MKKLIIGFCLFSLFALQSFGTALTDNRDTPSRSGQVVSLTQGSNHVYAGSIVCVDANGVALPGADATGLKMVGRASEESDNTTSYSSTQKISVERGTFAWANGAAYTDANIGDYTYVFDDATVNAAASNTYDIIAGVIVDVDSVNGVWVDCLASGGQGAASFTTVAASGTLDVTGVATFTATPICSGALTVTTTATAADLVATSSIDTQSLVVDTTSLHTGVATFTAVPVFTEVQAADVATGVAGVMTNLPAAATVDAAYFKCTVGADDYAVPMFKLP